MQKEIYSQILQKLTEYNHYFILTHPTPDGDALGASLGFYHLLKDRGKDVSLVFEGFRDPHLAFLLEGVDYQWAPQGLDGPCDCVIVLDIGDHKRVQPTLEKMASKDPFVINIDHHSSNKGFGHLDLVETQASSTGEIVYNILNSGEVPISPSMATAFYTAICTDTGFFTYSNTTPSALKAGSELLALGADHQAITRQILQSKPLALFQLESEYIRGIQFSPNSRVAWGTVSRQNAEKYGLPIFQVGDFVEIPRNIEGIEVSVIFREEKDPGTVKISFRSNDSDLDVNVFAQQFGGGGHVRAAGCVIEGELEAVARDVMDRFMKYYQEIKKTSP